ncbi:hypothetical protein [Cryobacterium adonitolivorans]|uniref:hypothetical protein n=1 Tax=Cryobacterium adonitolivorans TaxID=1259189 RepID=UPI0015839195|nr:hypothetical protein [Cryobacterium adonitolivorans]
MKKSHASTIGFRIVAATLPHPLRAPVDANLVCGELQKLSAGVRFALRHQHHVSPSRRVIWTV